MSLILEAAYSSVLSLLSGRATDIILPYGRFSAPTLSYMPREIIDRGYPDTAESMHIFSLNLHEQESVNIYTKYDVSMIG